MCVNPQTIRQKNGEYILVPCGKCVECMQDKQNEIAVLSVIEAEKCGSMEFITLTYSNDTIPMYFSICNTDRDTGEFEIYGDPCRVPDPEHEDFLRKEYFKNHVDCFTGDYYADDEEGIEYMITPSLCREDVKNWFKRCRINYKRHNGKDLDFKYVVCGEYGPNTGRPHFHIGIYGLSHEEVLDMCADWNKNYGFTYVESVKRFDQHDGYTKDHFEAASKYIGKYIAKGEFESIAVKEGRAEKPRRQTSIGFGIKEKDLDALKRYHYCFDLVGEYDPDNLASLNLTRAQWRDLCDEIIKRKKYNVNGKDYKLPRKIQRKLWYKQTTETDLDGEVKRKERRFEVFNLVSAYVRNIYNESFNAELQLLKDQYGDEVPYCEIRELVHRENVDRQSRAKSTFKNMYAKYSKNRF